MTDKVYKLKSDEQIAVTPPKSQAFLGRDQNVTLKWQSYITWKHFSLLNGNSAIFCPYVLRYKIELSVLNNDTGDSLRLNLLLCLLFNHSSCNASPLFSSGLTAFCRAKFKTLCMGGGGAISHSFSKMWATFLSLSCFSLHPSSGPANPSWPRTEWMSAQTHSFTVLIPIWR